MGGPGQAGRGGSGRAGDDDPDDVFFELEADDEVYEWFDEDPDQEAADTRGPRRPLRERLTEGVATLRGEARLVRRRAAGAGLAAVLAAAVAVGFTVWYDAVAEAADRADTVALTVDSIVDDDPAAAVMDSSGEAATVSYVVELANNGQDPVDVREVKADGGSLMGSTGWKPVGSPTIPAGGTARVRLTMHVNCTVALFGNLLSVGAANANMPFPDLDVTVLTRSGDLRSTVLSTKLDLASDRSGADPGSLPAVSPRIVMADSGPCQARQVARINAENQAGDQGTAVPYQNDLNQGPIASISYLGMTQAADGSAKTFRAKFHVVVKKNPLTTAPVNILSPFDQDGVTDEGSYTLTMLPKTVTVPLGGSADFTVQVQIKDCFTADADMFPDAGQLELLTLLGNPVDGGSSSAMLSRTLGSMVGDTVRLALDEITEATAACG